MLGMWFLSVNDFGVLRKGDVMNADSITIYNFVGHCVADSEFRDGILKRLGVDLSVYGKLSESYGYGPHLFRYLLDKNLEIELAQNIIHMISEKVPQVLLSSLVLLGKEELARVMFLVVKHSTRCGVQYLPVKMREYGFDTLAVEMFESVAEHEDPWLLTSVIGTLVASGGENATLLWLMKLLDGSRVRGRIDNILTGRGYGSLIEEAEVLTVEEEYAKLEIVG